MARLHGRPFDPLASTEFTYTRFLTPYLSGYEGWSLFMDCDMICLADISEVFDMADERFAVMCVQHDYEPEETVKMGNKAQTVYPRKNWSSLMLFNNKRCDILTPYVVNTASPDWLHQMKWAGDDIGEIPEEWNYLEGHSTCRYPRLVHYTRGIPGIHEGFADAAFSEEYLAEAKQTFGGK